MASTVCLVMSPMLISIFPIRRVYRHGWHTCHTAARPHTSIERAAFWIVLGSRHIHHSERSAVREAPLKPAASLHVERSRRRKTGQILHQNLLPGARSTLGQRSIERPGQWRFDESIRKWFKIGETKTMQV